MKYSLFSILLVGVMCVVGCSPELGLQMTVPNLPEPQAAVDASAATDPVKVKVGKFVDARASQTIATIDGRSVPSEGALGDVVQEGFTRYLRQAGVHIAILNSPMIDGEIVDWQARVKPSFPTSDAKATAKLRVIVRDSKSHPLYRATFSGEATASHPMLDEESIQKLLAQAMGSAIETAVKSDEFLAQLSKGRVE
jgi:hypothetical protein